MGALSEMSSRELKDGSPGVLAYLSSSAPHQESPRYPTCPSIAYIAGRYPVEIISPQSTLYDKPTPTPSGPYDKVFSWRVGVTLYKHSLNPGKIGPQTTHLGVDTSQKDQLAGLRTIDDPTYNSARGFAARIDSVHQDFVNTFNTAGNNTEVDRGVLEEAKTLLTELYQSLGGEHTVHDFGNLVPTFEAKAQEYISELRVKKGLSPDFRETRRLAYQWVERDTPRDTTDGEEGGGQGL